MDDFDKADKDAGAELVVPQQIDDNESLPTKRQMPSDVVKFRGELIEQYHGGAPTLVRRLREAGMQDTENLLVALIDEVITETDHLLGNELVATHNGELRDASVISFKRAEVLEKAIKAVQAKKQSESESGIDLDSPQMVTIFKYFMSKCADTFDTMGIEDEIKDLYFRTLSERMDNWKKELRELFEAMRHKG
jgi:hypothetical protein